MKYDKNLLASILRAIVRAILLCVLTYLLLWIPFRISLRAFHVLSSQHNRPLIVEPGEE